MRTLERNKAWQVGMLATQERLPDITFLLDLPVEIAMGRLHREHDRMESRGVEYLTRVREGFLEEARRDPERIRRIDADRSPDSIEEQIRSIAVPHLT